MNKESLFELQRIDCNCNFCVYMDRDLVEFKKWELWNKELQQMEFDRKKELARKAMESAENEQAYKQLKYLHDKMKFQFDKDCLIHYGDCLRFGKKVSFIPTLCEIENQHCFLHRRDFNARETGQVSLT